MDCPQSLPACIVEWCRLHLGKELSDHVADSHDLGRLLDQLSNRSRLVLLPLLFAWRALDGHGLWRHHIDPTVIGLPRDTRHLGLFIAGGVSAHVSDPRKHRLGMAERDESRLHSDRWPAGFPSFVAREICANLLRALGRELLQSAKRTARHSARKPVEAVS